MAIKYTIVFLLTAMLVMFFLFISQVASNLFSSPRSGTPSPITSHVRVIYPSDTGKIFVFSPSEKFSVFSSVPFSQTTLSCSPDDSVKVISIPPEIPSQSYAIRFETAAQGMCAFTFGSSSVSFRVR